jgi:F-type H+-transporting ATPase subunit epsilon
MTVPMLELEVLTPDKSVLVTVADAMRVLLPDGWWGILPGHAAMLSYIHSGMVYYQKDETIRYIAVYQGTIEVQQRLHEQSRVRILTAAAEEGDDLESVQLALSQQSEKLAQVAKEADMEFDRIRISLEKSLQGSNITDVGM